MWLMLLKLICKNYTRMGCSNQLYFQTALLMYDLPTVVQRVHQFHSAVLIAVVSIELPVCCFTKILVSFFFTL